MITIALESANYIDTMLYNLFITQTNMSSYVLALYSMKYANYCKVVGTSIYHIHVYMYIVYIMWSNTQVSIISS